MAPSARMPDAAADDHARPASHVARDRGVARVLWIVLSLNVSVAAIKFLVAWVTGTVALFADAIHTLLDGSANLVGIVGISIATRPADRDHPYGHRRFETIAAMAIGLLIASGLIGVLHGMWSSIRGENPAPHVTWVSGAVVAFTVLVNLFITRFERARGRALQSSLLTADASHMLADTFGAMAVLGSLAGVALGVRAADLVAAAIVALLIGKTAYEVLSENLGVLADTVRLDPAKVRAVAMSVDGVRGAHKVRSRGAIDHVLVDLHIHVEPTMSVAASHAITHRVIEAIRTEFPAVADVVIHTEPADGRESRPSDPLS